MFPEHGPHRTVSFLGQWVIDLGGGGEWVIAKSWGELNYYCIYNY